MAWFVKALRHYADFNGRAHRPEYWFFVLFYFLIALALGFVDGFVTGGMVSGLFGLVMLLPSLAVLARRLHDTDRSGWWILIGFIPLIGIIVLIVLACLPGTPGDNRYGPPPALTPA